MNPESPSQSFMLAGASAMTKPSDVYQISPNFENYAHNIKLRTLEWRVLFAIDGYRTVREICKQLHLDEDQAREIFGKLTLLSLIQEEEISLSDFLQRSPNLQIADAPVMTLGGGATTPARASLALPHSGFPAAPAPSSIVVLPADSDPGDFAEEMEEETPASIAPPPRPISRVGAEPPTLPSAVVVDVQPFQPFVPPEPPPKREFAPVFVAPAAPAEPPPLRASAPVFIAPPARPEPPPAPSPVFVAPPVPRSPEPPPKAPPVYIAPVAARAPEPVVPPLMFTPPGTHSPAPTQPIGPAASASAPAAITPPPPLPFVEPAPRIAKFSSPVPLIQTYEPTRVAPVPVPLPPALAEGIVLPPAPVRPLFGASPLPGTASIPVIPVMQNPTPPVPIALPRTGPISLINAPLPKMEPITPPFALSAPAVVAPAGDATVTELVPPPLSATQPIQRLTTLPPLGRRVESSAPTSITSAIPIAPIAPFPAATPPPFPVAPVVVKSAPVPLLTPVFVPTVAPVDPISPAPATPPPFPVSPLVATTPFSSTMSPSEPPPAAPEPESEPVKAPELPAPPTPAVLRFRLGAVVDYITKQSGGGTLGQLATYRVLLQVPAELLRESGIRSFAFDGSSEIEVNNPELQLALVTAVERTLNVQVPAGQFFR